MERKERRVIERKERRVMKREEEESDGEGGGGE